MKKHLPHLQWLISVASAVLFVYLLHRTTPAALLEKARLLGWGFVLLILLSGARHLLRTVAWRSCVEPGRRRPGLLQLFELRLVGEAFNDMTPAGPFLGETVKVWAASKHMPAQSSASSVVTENIIYGLAAVLFMLSGMALLLLEVTMPHRMRLIAAGGVMALLFSMGVPTWIINRRILWVGGILDRLKQKGVRWVTLERYEPNLRAAEKSIHDFFLTRRSIFLSILAIELATNFTGIGEAYLVLKATSAHSSLLAAYLVETTNRAVQLIFAFVPFGLGVEEGAAAATLRALGDGASEGVSLAVIRKFRTGFWAALGLILAAKYSFARPAAEERRA